MYTFLHPALAQTRDYSRSNYTCTRFLSYATPVHTWNKWSLVIKHDMRQVGIIIGGSCHKYNFCRDKHVFVRQNTSFVATKVCLSRQTYFCRDKYNFAVTKVLSRQTYFLQNMSFVATNVCLSRQTRVCRDKYLSRQKYFVQTKDVFCDSKHVFVATKPFSRQKLYLWQLPSVIGNWGWI